MKLHAGTSGFSYKEWKGSFYPEKMKEADMLAYYAGRFDTVELNNTFYRLPNETTMQGWASQVPPGFLFSLKASRRITHLKRLNDVAEPTGFLLKATEALGDARGPILFGLPPNMKLDLDRLRTFLDLLPPGTRAAIEFRHESWHDDTVFDALRERGVALCIAQTAEEETPFVATAGWGYLRLRREEYQASELVDWRERIAAHEWDEAFVYFKHEDAGVGPRLAREFLGMGA